MRNVRFFKKGSVKEIDFLKKKLAEGYILKNISSFLYSFEKKSDKQKDKLIVELMDGENLRFTYEMKTDLGIENIYEKKLFLTNYYSCYSYISHDLHKEFNNNNEESFSIELDYLKEFSDHFQTLKIVMILFGVIIWGGLSIIEIYTKNEFDLWKKNIPLVVVLIVCIISLLVSKKINKRISFLQERTGDFSDIWAPTLTVIIEHPLTSINIDQLSYIGNWRLIVVTNKKNDHYYKLESNFSEDEIISNVVEVLRIKPEQIKIVSYLGLFPIGWG